MNENDEAVNLLKPVTAYSFMVGVVSGTILILFGHGQMVLTGILFSYAGFWVLYLIFAVTHYLAMSFHLKHSKTAFSPFIALLLRIGSITLWTYFVLTFLIRLSTAPLIPYLLFSYFVVTAPPNLLSLNKGENADTSYEILLFDFMFAAAIFFGLLIDFDILSLVILTGSVVLAIRIMQIIIGLLERKSSYR